MMFQGKKVEPNADGTVPVLNPGEFCKAASGVWYGMTPNGHMATFEGHTVTEYGNGAISVTPSIQVSDETGVLYHGFLIGGVWNEC